MESTINMALISVAARGLLPIDVPFLSISCFIGEMSSIVKIMEKANNRALQPNISSNISPGSNLS